MKPKKHQLNLKHQKATALRISGKGQVAASFTERCEQIKLQALLGVGDPVKEFNKLEADTIIRQSVEQLVKGNLVHVDNTAPAAIVKANPRSVFNGELIIANTGMKQITTVPDELPEGWEFDMSTPTSESSLPLIAQNTPKVNESVTMPRFLMEEIAKKE